MFYSKRSSDKFSSDKIFGVDFDIHPTLFSR
eukprot:UN12268